VSLAGFKLFKDIAHTRSVSRGASLNGVTQSAASQRIREIESAIGAPLFDRSTRPVTLTGAGQLYAELSRDLLRRYEEFQTALARVKGEVRGAVRVASIYSVGLSEMSRIETEFEVRFPAAKLTVEYLRPDKVLEAVLTDAADLGLISYPEATRDISVIAWRSEEMVAAVAPGHRLASAKSIQPPMLEGVEFVAFDEGLPIRREIDRYLRESGVHVHVVMHFEVIQMIKEAVALGSGVSILPRRIIQPDVQQGRIVAVPLGGGGLMRPLGIIHRRKNRLSPATEAFLRLLTE
jgi:DNA-binding transcriptional LysR family regulator